MKRLMYLIPLVLVFFACQSGTGQESAPPIEKYKSYTKDGVFDSKQFLEDNSGIWVCYKYEKDTIEPPHSNFVFDEDYAKDVASYYYLKITKDTLSFSKYKMPIQCKKYEIKGWHSLFQERFHGYAQVNSANLKLDFVYIINGLNGMYYGNYFEMMQKKGELVPYFDGSQLGDWLWCYPGYIVFNYYGYNFFLKRGVPNNKGITGFPGHEGNRFTVERTYKNATIKEAAYKLIEEFPSGTRGLLFIDDEPSDEPEFFSEKSFELSLTKYKWQGKDKLTIRVTKDGYCTFVFEFNKTGNDVHVKFWNDVIFPFEEGYED